MIGIISPNHEPSTHALNDLSARARQLEETGCKILLLFEDEALAGRFKAESFPQLPSNVVFGIDKSGVSLKEIKESLHLAENVGKPVFAIADTFQPHSLELQRLYHRNRRHYPLGSRKSKITVIDFIAKYYCPLKFLSS